MLEIFDQTTMPQFLRKREAVHTISISVKGKITFNTALIRHLGLDVASKIAFVCYDKQLYFIPNYKNGYPLRTSKMTPEGPKDLLFAHQQLADYIIGQIPEKIRNAHPRITTYRIMVSKVHETVQIPNGDFMNVYPIITNSATFTARKK